jgi:hypothetical protein
MNGYLNVDFKEAYNITDEDRKPELSLVSYAMVDSVGGDGDGRPDSGDTISFYPVLKNMWGQAENIKMTLQVGEAEDPEIIEVLDSEVEFGRPLSSYAKNRSVNPIRFVVNPNCVDGRHIKLLFKATCDNIQATLEHELVITAENGVEIGGVITEDLTLYPNVHYIVTKKILVPEGTTFTIKPGTVLKFRENTGLLCEGKFIAKGTPDSMIVFTGDYKVEAPIIFNNTDTLSYAIIENITTFPDNTYSNILKLKNVIIKNVYSRHILGGNSKNNFELYNCVIKDNIATGFYGSSKVTLKNTVLSNNNIGHINGSNARHLDLDLSNLKSCNTFSHFHTVLSEEFDYGDYFCSVRFYSSSIKIYKSEYPSYLGSSHNDILIKSNKFIL